MARVTIPSEKRETYRNVIRNYDNLIVSVILDDSRRVSLEEMRQSEIEKQVEEVIRPHKRGSNTKIVLYDKSRDRYFAKIPMALCKDSNKTTLYAKTEKELWQKLHNYLIGVTVTLEDLYAQFISERTSDKDVSSRTIDHYEYAWNRWYRDDPIIKRPLPTDTSVLLDFIKKHTAGRALKKKDGNALIGLLRMLYDTAIAHGYVKSNPVKDLPTSRIKYLPVHSADKVYMPDERRALFKVLDPITDDPYAIAIQLMFCLDIRIGELAALEWSDYDESKQVISINKQIVTRRINGKNKAVMVPYTKGGETGSRLNPVTPKAAEILAKAKRYNPNSKTILTNTVGNYIATNKFNERLRKYCAIAGVTYLSSHKIRAFAITSLVRAGANPLDAQYYSGHARIATTNGYMRGGRFYPLSHELFDTVFN